MFEDILVPVDFSRASRGAILLASRLARDAGGTITLLHVDEFGALPGASAPDADPALAEMHRRYAEDLWTRLEDAAEQEVPEGVTCKCRLASGYPAAAILSQIQEGGHDLVVMGTHGRTADERVLVGSVTERVLARCPVPVLVTR